MSNDLPPVGDFSLRVMRVIYGDSALDLVVEPQEFDTLRDAMKDYHPDQPIVTLTAYNDEGLALPAAINVGVIAAVILMGPPKSPPRVMTAPGLVLDRGMKQ